MSVLARTGPRWLGAALAAAVALATPSFAATAQAAPHPHAPHAVPTMNKISSDPYSDAQAQHATEVEPDTFSFGSTVVSAFQVGRVSGGGASNIGWTTSTDGGQTWTNGFIPASTTNTGGPYASASDASVAYDAKDNVWMVSWLGITTGSDVDVELSRSTDGGHTWGSPVTISTGTFDDKNWTVCDNHSTSPFYGHCYTEYDDANAGDAEHMRTSTNGGQTWGAQLSPADGPSGLGGQPVVQPGGTVVVPFSSASSNAERAFTSTNGGSSWGSSVQIATVSHHPVAGLEDLANDIARLSPRDTLRESPLPSAEIDAAGKVYAIWSDCRFRSGCPSNDIIMSTSTNGTTWSTPVRVPIDAVTSTADHFTAGIGVDPNSSGNTARIALTYYYYPNASCTDTTCQLDAGYVSSTDGGTTWTPAVQLAGPMTLAWLPNTSQGRMFGDYISTSVLAGGNAVTVIPIAQAPSGSTFDVGMYAAAGGLPVGTTTGSNTVTVTSPGNQTGTVGTGASLQIHATDSAGVSLTYSATGLPAGLAISSTGLITGTPTTAGTSNVTVTATDTTGASGTASFTWTINPVGGGNGVLNGGFETGSFSNWTTTGNAAVTAGAKHSGSYGAMLGLTTPSNTSTAAQTFTAPTGTTKLSFYYNVTCPDTVTYDWATATLKDNTTGTTTTVLAKTCVSSSGWVLKTASITAGHSYTLTLTNKDDNYPGDPTYTYYDDITTS